MKADDASVASPAARALRRLAALIGELAGVELDASFFAIALVNTANGSLEVLWASGAVAGWAGLEIPVNRGWLCDLLATPSTTVVPFARISGMVDERLASTAVHARAVPGSVEHRVVLLAGASHAAGIERPADWGDSTLADGLGRIAAAIEAHVRETETQRTLLTGALRANTGLRIAAAIDDGWDATTAAEFALAAIHDQLGHGATDLGWVSDDRRTLTLAALGGEHARVLKRGLALAAEHTLRGEAVRAGKAVRVGDTALDRRYRALPGTLPMRSQAIVPVMAGGRVLGTLSIEADQPIAALELRALEPIAERLGRLREAALRREAIERDERRRLAHELHDSVIQSFTALRMLAEGLPAAVAAADPEVADQARRIQSLARHGLAELRNIVNGFDPARAQRAGISLQSQAVLGSEQLQSTSFPATVESIGRTLVPPSMRYSVAFSGYERRALADELMLLRVCHEAISNATRHSGAQSVRVVGVERGGTLVIRVIDDGRGLDVGAAGDRGVGLASMRERVAKLGGTVEIERGTPGGTEVVLRLRSRQAQVA